MSHVSSKLSAGEPPSDPEQTVHFPSRSSGPLDQTGPLDQIDPRDQIDQIDQVDPLDADLELLAPVDRTLSRTTVLLLAGILATVAFIVGGFVQKTYGSSSNSTAAAGFAGRAGAYGGASGAGGFPGGGAGFPGGGTGGTGSTGGAGSAGSAGASGAAGGSTAGTSASTPVVVGTVTKIAGNKLTVQNLGGKSVSVTVPADAQITLVAGKNLAPKLTTGATVSVAGTAAEDGAVTATSVTVRS